MRLSRSGADAMMAAAGEALAHYQRVADKYGEEPPIGSVVRWQKVYKSGTTYSYAAINTELGWYTTGPRSPKAYTWDDLINWVDAGGTEFNFERIAGPFGPQHRVVKISHAVQYPDDEDPCGCIPRATGVHEKRTPDPGDADMLDADFDEQNEPS